MFRCIKKLIYNWRVNRLIGIVPIKLKYKISASYKDENTTSYKKLAFEGIDVSNIDIIVRPNDTDIDTDTRVDLPIDFSKMSTKDKENFLVAILLEYANMKNSITREYPIYIKKLLKHMKKHHDIDEPSAIVTARTYGGALDLVRDFLSKTDLDLNTLGICLFYNDNTTVFINNERQKLYPLTLRELTKKRGEYHLLKLKLHNGAFVMLSTITFKLELSDMEILEQ